MASIIFSVNEVDTSKFSVNVLKDKRNYQRGKMQRVKAGKPCDQKRPCIDRANPNRVSIFNKEYKSTDAPKDLNPKISEIVKYSKYLVERLTNLVEINKI